ncbi:hypothetical protein ACQJBY_067468 [Aegilops geniculata]
MGTAAAGWLIGKVLNMLSDDLVAAYVDSTQLGLNSEKIKRDLQHTRALLEMAQASDLSDNHDLREQVQALNAKAHEADDALDELHYFIIEDRLNNTKRAVPDLGDGMLGHAQHGRHAARHAVGNWLKCLSCSCAQDDDSVDATPINNPVNATNTHTAGDNVPPDRLPFDRVAMSKKIKSLIEDLNEACESVSRLLDNIKIDGNTRPDTLNRPPLGSMVPYKNNFYGRNAIFEQTVYDITTGAKNRETLSVIPVVGTGGIGKTTFAQHLYIDKRIEQHFDVRGWVSVSTDFNVTKLSQQLLGSIEGSNTAKHTSLDQLQRSIAEKLNSRRFLVVFDDIWKCNDRDWGTMLAPFVGGVVARGSIVLVTTRFPLIANMVNRTHQIELEGLQPDELVTLFEDFIFDGEKPEHYQDDLSDVGRNIASKLKGSPLAAKTVGRLLKKRLSREYWMKVLENDEWQKEDGADDIMPSLKISYNYLPFRLQKCFQYFSLFPEDYKFKNLEITYFWIAIGIIDKDENYMEELVDNGFLVKEMEDQYLLHDLLHELSRKISSQECLNIYSSGSFRSDDIPQSVRYISITMGDTCDEIFRREMVELKSKVDIVNCRALMIFVQYERAIYEILEDTFKKIERLRVLFIVSESVETLPSNFSKLIHLRCLKIAGSFNRPEGILPNTLSRFYHLKLLDLIGWCGSAELPKDISRLINLHHLCSGKDLHSNIPEVGKMKCLKELKEFHVKKESVGFELTELGELTNLGGELRIHNLEKLATREEATGAKLILKSDLKKLGLVWDTNQHNPESDVLDGLEPHRDLGTLGIKNHGGSAGPSWLCRDIKIQMLGSLYLEGVSWVTLPPFGQLLHLTSLTLVGISSLDQIRPGFGGVTDKSFKQLKRIVLHNLPGFIKWVGVPNSHSFSKLEYISCQACPILSALPFLQEGSAVSYNHLLKLVIRSCPELFLPPMPHTSTIPDFDVTAGESALSSGIVFCKDYWLTLNLYNGALAWHNMAHKIKCISFENGSDIPWGQLPMLTSLEYLDIQNDPRRSLSIAPLSNLTSLRGLALYDCRKITLDGFTLGNVKGLTVRNTRYPGPGSVAVELFSELLMLSRTEQLLPTAGSFLQLEKLQVDSSSTVLIAPICTLLAPTLHELIFWGDNRVESFTEEEENALQLLTSLQTLGFTSCPALPSLPQTLHSLSSLRKLGVVGCMGIKSFPNEGIPSFLKALDVRYCSSELLREVDMLRQTNPDLQTEE